MGRKFTVCAAVWLVIGIVFLCTGCVLIYVFGKLIRNKIDSVSTPLPLFFASLIPSNYFYAVHNIEGMINGQRSSRPR